MKSFKLVITGIGILLSILSLVGIVKRSRIPGTRRHPVGLQKNTRKECLVTDSTVHARAISYQVLLSY